MSGHWASSRRRQQLPPDWDRRCQRVKERDQGRCQRCRNKCAEKRGGRWFGGEVDHHHDKHDHRLANLQLLCTPCHKRKTQLEAQAARKLQRRPAGRHPGLIEGGGP